MKNKNSVLCCSFSFNWDLDMFSISKWPSAPKFCEIYLCSWQKMTKIGPKIAKLKGCLFYFEIEYNLASITVCWIGVKLVVLCAQQYIPRNLLIIKVLNNFWYFKHQIPSRTCSEAYLKHYWRNSLQKLYSFTFVRDNFFNNVSNMLLSKF